MATTPEGRVKARIKKILEELGCYYFMPPANGYGHSGRFDICCSYYGHFIGIEVKADAKKKPTALQTRNASQCAASGGSVLLLHNENLTCLVHLLRNIKDTNGQGFSRAHIWPTDG